MRDEKSEIASQNLNSLSQYNLLLAQIKKLQTEIDEYKIQIQFYQGEIESSQRSNFNEFSKTAQLNILDTQLKMLEEQSDIKDENSTHFRQSKDLRNLIALMRYRPPKDETALKQKIQYFKNQIREEEFVLQKLEKELSGLNDKFQILNKEGQSKTSISSVSESQNIHAIFSGTSGQNHSVAKNAKNNMTDSGVCISLNK